MSDDDWMNQPEVQRLARQYERIAERANAPKRVKNGWIALARRFFQPGDRAPCVVCGKFKVIAQAHHIVPLEQQYDDGYEVPDQRYVWLCPNHHELVHVFIKRTERRVNATIANGDLSDDEFAITMKVVSLSAGEQK